MKTIQELIEEGIKIKTTCAQTNIQTIVRGDVYADWLTYCERLLRQQFPDDPQTIEFCEIARKANGNDVKVLERLIGILKAFADIPPIDIARYGDKCKTLVCFIYDKGSFLSNPYGLISDLEALSSDRLQVKVYIAPI